MKFDADLHRLKDDVLFWRHIRNYLPGKKGKVALIFLLALLSMALSSASPVAMISPCS